MTVSGIKNCDACSTPVLVTDMSAPAFCGDDGECTFSEGAYAPEEWR